MGYIDEINVGGIDSEVRDTGTRKTIAPTETTPYASKDYVKDAYFIWDYADGKVYQATAAIAQGAQFVVGTNIKLIGDIGDAINQAVTDEALTRASAISTEASTRAAADTALRTRIDQIVAPTGEAPNPAEITDARIGVDGDVFSTLGEAIRGQIGDLKNDLEDFNSVNLIAKHPTSNKDAGGISWRWQSDGSCIVSGTSTDAAVYLLAGGTNAIPEKFIPGKKYYIDYTSKKVALQFASYRELELVEDKKFYQSDEYTIPENITGLRIRLIIGTNNTVNETVKPIILTAPSNKDIDEKANRIAELGFTTSSNDNNFGLNDDLDDIKSIGVWKCSSSAIAQSLLNNPFNNVIRLFVISLSSTSGVIMQMVFDRYSGEIATRTLLTTSKWTSWIYSGKEQRQETPIIDDESAWHNDGVIRRSGESSVAEDTFSYSDFISVTAGDYLHLISCTSTDDYYMCIFYDSAYNFINSPNMNLRYATYDDMYVIAPTNAAYMRALVRKTNASNAKIYKVTSRTTETVNSVGIKVLENFASETGNGTATPFMNLKKEHGPLFTLIDDDTRTLHQVTDFIKICDDNGIFGTSACITKFPVQDSSIKNALIAGELKGHQTVFHCHDQYANSHWSDEETYRDEILENVAQGMHEISDMGFCDWKHWVTPAGVHGPLITSLAKRYGFDSLISITQNDFMGYDNYWTRWYIPRMELYPDDIDHKPGQTLAGIKTMIDKCVAQNGWLLVGIHTFQESGYSSSFDGTKGWNNLDGQPNIYANDVQSETDQTRFEARFQRIYEMINYAKAAGMTGVTLGEGLAYWEPVFRMYESF